MSEDISLGQFKEQVLRDYRVAYMGREARRAAMVEADCHYVTALSDVAQAALARFAEAEDAYISAGLDLTAELALGRQTPSGFFRPETYSRAACPAAWPWPWAWLWPTPRSARREGAGG